MRQVRWDPLMFSEPIWVEDVMGKQMLLVSLVPVWAKPDRLDAVAAVLVNSGGWLSLETDLTSLRTKFRYDSEVGDWIDLSEGETLQEG